MSSQAVRGFVLQPTYRVEAGKPVVHLHGRFEGGGTFLVREHRERPHFFVETRDAGRAAELGARLLGDAGRTTFESAAVSRVETGVPADVPPLRDRLQRAGIVCYEADVRFALRLLIDRGIRGCLAIRGASRPEGDIDRVFDDPELASADWTPRLSVLSLDIETDPTASRLLSVGLFGCGANEVLLLTPPGTRCPPPARGFPDEASLLRALRERVRVLDPDVLTGWNVVDFDLRVLQRLAGRHGVPLELGRAPGPLGLRADRGGRQALRASIPGRVVLDGLALLRGAFVRMEEYTLDHVAREVLGEGKLVHGKGRAAEILRMFEDDRERFVEYNLADARLALEIVERLGLVELAVERSRLTGMPVDRVASSIAAFDFLYLSELQRRRIVAPSVRADRPAEVSGGGQVLEPQPGTYAQVAVLDFRSLYPSLIRTFQIDPLNLVRSGPPSDDTLVAPNGAAFRRTPGILPAILDDLMPRRAQALAAHQATKAQALKILMNSFYGVLGTPACRFHDARLANAITSFGRELLSWCRDFIEARGHRVLYGDTDSLFIATDAADAGAAHELGRALAAALNVALTAHVRSRWAVESRLEIQFERLYLRLFLPSMRRAVTGARKRYVGLVDEPGGARVVFTGMEAVRGDWTELARSTQRELYARFFADQPVDAYVRGVADALRAGRLDAQLVYRKTLRKPPDEYTTTTPPHVAAARLAGRRRGRIAYVMTTAGPQPVEERQTPLDYAHYLEKQLRPVAEPVLVHLGLDFDDVAATRRQLSLF